MNDYKTPGTYYIHSAVLNSISNKPTTWTSTGGIVIVDAFSDTNHLTQSIRQSIQTFNGRKYWRNCLNGTTWDSDWHDETYADLGYVVKEIQSFSVAMNNGYATLGTTQEFGVPSGAHVIACTLIGWSSLSSGDIYLTASDTGVYIISGENSISANYIRFRLTYANI